MAFPNVLTSIKYIILELTPSTILLYPLLPPIKQDIKATSEGEILYFSL
jgi:hypothetical protein